MKKAIEAAKVLHDYCASFGCECRGCCFYEDDSECILGMGSPFDWKIPTTRWTPADKALAKALKMFRVERIEKDSSNYMHLRDDSGKICGWVNLVCVQPFESLESGEMVSLDEIIGEDA